MKRKVGILVAAIVAIPVAIGIAVVAVKTLSERKANRVVTIDVSPVAYASGEVAIARGGYLFRSRGCSECHGVDGGGKVVIDDPNGLHVASPNITMGAGSAVSGYGEVDWVRAIRHGIDRDGHPLLIMPGEDYNRLTDEDLAAVVAYVRALPPIAGKPATVRFPLIVQALYAFGVVRDAAEKIDHGLPPSQPVPVAVTAEHGAYVANMCIGCHRHDLTGGPIAGAPPSWPPAADLTPRSGSAMARYDTGEKFVAMMRSGKRPDGSAVSTVMPFPSLAAMDETDLLALHTYLRSLPAPKSNP